MRGVRVASFWTVSFSVWAAGYEKGHGGAFVRVNLAFVVSSRLNEVWASEQFNHPNSQTVPRV